MNKSISEITFMKSELDIDNTRSRTKMVDLVVKTKENEVIHVEVNSSISERTKFRNYCFFINIISNDTRRREYYDSSRKYVHIDLTWGVSGNYVKYNYYIQNSEGKRYINNVEIIEANMEYIKKNCYNDEKLKYIAMLDMNLEELDKIREDEVVMNYKSELERMNENEEFQRYMSVEKMNEMDRNTALYEAREEGLTQGMLRKSVEAANLTVGEVEDIINS